MSSDQKARIIPYFAQKYTYFAIKPQKQGIYHLENLKRNLPHFSPFQSEAVLHPKVRTNQNRHSSFFLFIVKSHVA